METTAGKLRRPKKTLTSSQGRKKVPVAYDERLTGRVRKLMKAHSRVTEREQFGGIGFLVRGNMACGVLGQDLLVRVGPAGHEAALAEKHVRPFALTGRPSRGWVLVAPAGMGTEARLRRWVEAGLRFAQTLPPK
jgi:TfoX/Sxy family transcriptional regulator of competence genes